MLEKKKSELSFLTVFSFTALKTLKTREEVLFYFVLFSPLGRQYHQVCKSS